MYHQHLNDNVLTKKKKKKESSNNINKMFQGLLLFIFLFGLWGILVGTVVYCVIRASESFKLVQKYDKFMKDQPHLAQSFFTKSSPLSNVLASQSVAANAQANKINMNTRVNTDMTAFRMQQQQQQQQQRRSDWSNSSNGGYDTVIDINSSQYPLASNNNNMGYDNVNDEGADEYYTNNNEPERQFSIEEMNVAANERTFRTNNPPRRVAIPYQNNGNGSSPRQQQQPQQQQRLSQEMSQSSISHQQWQPRKDLSTAPPTHGNSKKFMPAPYTANRPATSSSSLSATATTPHQPLPSYVPVPVGSMQQAHSSLKAVQKPERYSRYAADDFSYAL